MACGDTTIEQLGLEAGYSVEDLEAALAVYVPATYGESAVLNGYTDNNDGTVHLCVSQ